MSWFELQAAELDYMNLMGSWRNGESSPYGLLDLSFSDVPGWAYLIFVALNLFVLRCIWKVVNHFNDRYAIFFKIGLALLVVLYIYGLYVAMLLWNVPWVSIFQTMREGVFGDSFGTLNTLFSGLAFAGILMTLLFQRIDLSETRNQIADQNFESHFYSMLNHQQEVVRSLDLQDEKTNVVIAQGRDCFRFWDRYLKHRYNKQLRLFSSVDAHTVAYDIIYRHFRSDFRLYFRSLYTIFKLVDECKHPNKDYFKVLVCSLITDYELKFIFYNSLTHEGERFSDYVNKFSLLENLDETMLLKKDHINFYGVSAYGGNQRLIDKLKVSCK